MLTSFLFWVNYHIYKCFGMTFDWSEGRTIIWWGRYVIEWIHSSKRQMKCLFECNLSLFYFVFGPWTVYVCFSLLLYLQKPISYSQFKALAFCLYACVYAHDISKPPFIIWNVSNFWQIIDKQAREETHDISRWARSDTLSTEAVWSSEQWHTGDDLEWMLWKF